uniref:Uncharacterized protein n=1 Tax=Anguilla anguilla TaxID=7936 RepID=A0A0E9W3V3_ANGAN
MKLHTVVSIMVGDGVCADGFAERTLRPTPLQLVEEIFSWFLSQSCHVYCLFILQHFVERLGHHVF